MQIDLTTQRRVKFAAVAEMLKGGIGLDGALQAAAAQVADSGDEDAERRFWGLLATTPATLRSADLEGRIRRAIEGETR
ncbi:hypothetical protein [Rhodospirillaceae bacterium SYSU D60014]|uniref:hypothetical protein n=1 Tax=Virgifigura deserti TaxID=2268457 RepID=UPI000E65F3DC